MAETMQFDLVSPERSLASMKVEAVQIPGADGDMTAMAGHAPTITTLRPGVLSVSGPEGSADFAVTGGFAEITGEGTSVLAERAVPIAEVDGEMMDNLVKTAEELLTSAQPHDADNAAKVLADVRALKAQLNL